MSEELYITDGEVIFDFLAPDQSGFEIDAEGWEFQPSIPEIQIIEAGLRDGAVAVSHRWKNVNDKIRGRLWGTSHNDLAQKIVALQTLCERSMQRIDDEEELADVYLVHRYGEESYRRYGVIVWGHVSWAKPFYRVHTRKGYVVTDVQVTLERKPFWRDLAPGVYPSSKLTLGPTNGPATPKLVHASNFYGNADITHVFNYSGGFSSNLQGIEHTIFDATPAADDIYYIGSQQTANPFAHVALKIKTASVHDAHLHIEYYNGSWMEVPATKYMIYPTGSPDDLFKRTGDYVISLYGLADWQTLTVNTIEGWWIRIYIVTVATWNTAPIATDDDLYCQREPVFKLPADQLVGDAEALLNVHILSSDGGVDTTPDWRYLSRALIAVREAKYTNFVSALNATDDAKMPSGWDGTLGTDASLEDAIGEGPDGRRLKVTFGGEDAIIERFKWQGTNRLADYVKGTFRVFLVVQQHSGAAEDVTVGLRVMLGADDDTSPQYDTKRVTLKAVDKGLEVIDLGGITIPFLNVAKADYTTADLIFKLLAGREDGSSAELYAYTLRIMPDNILAWELDDPITNSELGSSALRADTLIEIDAGIIEERCIKMLIDNSGNLIPAETWSRNGKPPILKPARAYNWHVLMLHYPSDGWGILPMMASVGMHFAVEMYGVNRFKHLRGAVE